MESTNKQKTNAKKVWRIVGNVFIWLFIAFSVIVTVFAFSAKANDDVVTIAGKIISPVLTTSMDGDAMKKGDIIISQKLSPDDAKKLEVGDIITFRVDLSVPPDGQLEVNTHRIIERIESEDGDITYKTKGDNNAIQDNYTIGSADVLGKYTGKRIPLLGNFIAFLMTPTGFFICIVIPLILFFLFEIIMFVRKVIEVKNADKKQITEEDEEMIKRKAVEEYIRSQQEAASNEKEQSTPEAEAEPETEAGTEAEAGPEAEDADKTE